jgi:hypothetical protein
MRHPLDPRREILSPAQIEIWNDLSAALAMLAWHERAA